MFHQAGLSRLVTYSPPIAENDDAKADPVTDTQPNNGATPATGNWTLEEDCAAVRSHHVHVHEPRRSNHKRVSAIYNRVVRQRERLTCQVLCQSGCHVHKTWVNLDWNKVGVIIAKKGTSEDRMKYLVLKLKRFEGLDDDESRRDEKGCQGYKDGKGGHYECPFQE
jgi:hypothetical protein